MWGLCQLSISRFYYYEYTLEIFYKHSDLDPPQFSSCVHHYFFCNWPIRGPDIGRYLPTCDLIGIYSPSNNNTITEIYDWSLRRVLQTHQGLGPLRFYLPRDPVVDDHYFRTLLPCSISS